MDAITPPEMLPEPPKKVTVYGDMMADDYRFNVVIEGLRRGILEADDIIKIKTSWEDLDVLREEMSGWTR